MNRFPTFSALLSALLLIAASAPTAAQTARTSRYDLGVREHVFDNGLRLLVVERPGDPRVTEIARFDDACTCMHRLS